MKLDGDKHSIRKKDMPNLEDLYSLTICQFYIKFYKNIVQPYYLCYGNIWQKQKR